MISSLLYDAAKLPNKLLPDTPAGNSSESRAQNIAVDASYRLVNGTPLEWLPAPHSFQLASEDEGAPVGGSGNFSDDRASASVPNVSYSRSGYGDHSVRSSEAEGRQAVEEAIGPR